MKILNPNNQSNLGFSLFFLQIYACFDLKKHFVLDVLVDSSLFNLRKLSSNFCSVTNSCTWLGNNVFFPPKFWFITFFLNLQQLTSQQIIIYKSKLLQQLYWHNFLKRFLLSAVFSFYTYSVSKRFHSIETHRVWKSFFPFVNWCQSAPIKAELSEFHCIGK